MTASDALMQSSATSDLKRWLGIFPLRDPCTLDLPPGPQQRRLQFFDLLGSSPSSKVNEIDQDSVGDALAPRFPSFSSTSTLVKYIASLAGERSPALLRHPPTPERSRICTCLAPVRRSAGYSRPQRAAPVFPPSQMSSYHGEGSYWQRHTSTRRPTRRTLPPWNLLPIVGGAGLLDKPSGKTSVLLDCLSLHLPLLGSGLSSEIALLAE
ncbi:hypothetical protein B0H16DRAFT_1852099 [Mycena metata]|uniref:Uncharacterized protein n=1 Tax=Mycena metata TaxID=1033252 RepID=A0AAD7IQG6_9AGAR|nr:hypothetical protein B0H16DRAFT_1852099 [Mycena metata]